jgi:hypothetical protein
VFWKHLSNTTWWSPISIASVSSTITKALASGYKLFKLVNGSCWESKSERSWTQRSKFSASSRTRRLDVDGWESWIESSGMWTKENSQSSRFFEAMLSTIETKKKQSKLIMTWSNPQAKTVIFLYMFFTNFFKKLAFSDITSMTLPRWYLIKQK